MTNMAHAFDTSYESKNVRTQHFLFLSRCAGVAVRHLVEIDVTWTLPQSHSNRVAADMREICFFWKVFCNLWEIFGEIGWLWKELPSKKKRFWGQIAWDQIWPLRFEIYGPSYVHMLPYLFGLFWPFLDQMAERSVQLASTTSRVARSDSLRVSCYEPAMLILVSVLFKSACKVNTWFIRL